MQEKMIPVIGVPPASSLQTFPDKNAPKPPKNASRIKNPVAQPKKKLRDTKSQTRRLVKAVEKAKELAKKPLMKKVKMSELIQETGMPSVENGPYVLAEEAKLTEVEKMAQNYWVELNPLLDASATVKQHRKQAFKMRLVWLLNKTTMLNATNLEEMEKKVANETDRANQKRANILAAREARKEKKKLLKNPPENGSIPSQKIQKIVNEKKPEKQKEEKETILVDLTHLTPEKPKIRKLMDVEVPKPRSSKLTEQLRDFYEKNSMRNDLSGRQETGGGGGGYQYLNEDWYNGDKPWRKFQTSSSSDFYSSSYDTQGSSSTSSDPTMMAQWAQMAPTTSMDPYGFFQTTSSYGASTGYPIPQQPSFATTDFTSPPPAMSPLATNLANRQAPRTPDASLDPLAPGVSPGYVSQYRQAFPVDSTLQFSIPQPQSIQPASSSSSSYGNIQQVLEVSEEELARQKRLLEIEEELRMINARKVQMQMEEEIRQREFDLALKMQRMQERERRMREREESSSSHRRHRHDDHRGSSSRHRDSRDDDYYHQQRRSPYSDRHHYSNSSSSSSNPSRHHHQQQQKQISIEHESGGGGGGGSGRRYGGQLLLHQQNKMRDALPRDGGQECYPSSSSLKRQADHGYDYEEYDNNGGHQEGSILPAKRPNRRPRHRKNRDASQEQELQMQAISDDED